MSQPRAILFDLDDTLIDDSGETVRLWREVTFGATRDGGHDRGEQLLAEIDRVRAWYWSDPERHRQGRQDLRASTQWIVEQAVRSTYGRSDPELAASIAGPFWDKRDAAQKLLPGAITTLERVRGTGARMALVTNGSAAAQRAKIEHFDLRRYFDHVLIEGELGRGKPDPAVFSEALGRLGVAASDAWMIGDNLAWDVAGPQAVGIFGIWIDRYDRGLPAGSTVIPDRIVRSVAEL